MRSAVPTTYYTRTACNSFVSRRVARIGDAEAAVAVCDYLEVMAVAVVLQIRDQRLRAVVRGVGVFGGVQHPQVCKAGTFMHGLPGFGAAGLVRAVVHDGHAGMNRVDKGRELERLNP